MLIPEEEGVLREKVLGVLRGLPGSSDRVALDTSFDSSEFTPGGFDSLDVIEVVMEIEEALDVHISDKAMSGMRCGEDIVAYLLKAQKP